MKKLFDFRCSTCKTKFEVLTEATDTVRCNKCGSPSHRVISPIRCQLDPASGDFPGATMKWIREHESRGGLTQTRKE